MSRAARGPAGRAREAMFGTGSRPPIGTPILAALLCLVTALPATAATLTGPEAPLAPGQDRPAAGSARVSTVYRDPDGEPYVLKGANEKQYLRDYNVTWVDKTHVIAPPGVGGFD